MPTAAGAAAPGATPSAMAIVAVQGARRRSGPRARKIVAQVSEGSRMACLSHRLRLIAIAIDYGPSAKMPGSAACADRAQVFGVYMQIQFIDKVPGDVRLHALVVNRSEEHTSELQSLMRISYAVFCLKKKKKSKIEVTHQIDN